MATDVTDTYSRPTTTRVAQAERGFDVVAVAASAGGLHALSIVLAALPSDFPACVMVVQHLSPHHPSLLSTILARYALMRVKEAEDGEMAQPSVVYIGPPDHHLLLTPAHILSLTTSNAVHYLRPSADLLFASVARASRARAIALVLSGTGSDGSQGVRDVWGAGGITIAQAEESCEFFGMPGSAIQTGCISYVIPLGEIAPALVNLVNHGDIR
jgi:two-component system, chemotaxis family, protein-glutamate methylesterase/glutaminase